MSTSTLTAKPGNQLWGIYHTDREYARQVGDPIRTVIEAPTKVAAEEAAIRLGFGNPWAHSVTSEQAEQAQWLPKRPSSPSPATRPQTVRRHPPLTRHIPTTAQLRTAVEVLKKLEQRINNHATHSTIHLPDTSLGDDYAARIESQTTEQIARIKTVMSQLETWRNELTQERRQCVTHHI